MTIDYDKLYNRRRVIAPSSSSTYEVTSASTGEVIGRVPEGQEADIDAAVAAARRAFDDPTGWSQWEPARRAAAMESLADEYDKRSAEFARRVSMQNGMPIAIAERARGWLPDHRSCATSPAC